MYRVLLVEDDSQIREVIGDYFGRREKIALDLAQDGNTGLSKILNEEYDLSVNNPHKVEEVDERTPSEIAESIYALGQESQALIAEIMEMVK